MPWSIGEWSHVHNLPFLAAVGTCWLLAMLAATRLRRRVIYVLLFAQLCSKDCVASTPSGLFYDGRKEISRRYFSERINAETLLPCSIDFRHYPKMHTPL